MIKIKKIFTGNIGLKTMALFLAFFVWAMITGKERSYSEQTLDCSVEYFNVSKTIDVSSVNPDKALLTVRGTTKELAKLDSEDLKIKIDLKNVTEGTLHNYFTEDHIELPEGIQLLEAQPKMITITVKEFISKEVPVRVRYRGKMKRGVRLIDRRVVPDKVRIFGYKSQLDTITTIEGAEYVNLSDIETSKSIKIPLKKEKEVLRFEDTDTVEVFIEVENLNKKKDEPGEEK
jgi:YbbR domain-containing protein